MSAWNFDGQDALDLQYLQEQFEDIELFIEKNPDTQLSRQLTSLKKRWSEELKYHLSQEIKLCESIDEFLVVVGIREE